MVQDELSNKIIVMEDNNGNYDNETKMSESLGMYSKIILFKICLFLFQKIYL